MRCVVSLKKLEHIKFYLNEYFKQRFKIILEHCSGALLQCSGACSGAMLRSTHDYSCSGADCSGALKILTAPEHAAPEQSEKCCSYALLFMDLNILEKIIFHGFYFTT
jgi:hypothetical protein